MTAPTPEEVGLELAIMQMELYREYAAFGKHVAAEAIRESYVARQLAALRIQVRKLQEGK